MLCRTDNIMKNILHIQYACEEYFGGLTIYYKIFLTFRLNVRNIPHYIVGLAIHCYDFE